MLRKIVDRYESELFTVSTILPYDDPQYETAIYDKNYHHSFIVVEQYTTEEEAKMGHAKWVDIMLSNPPDKLEDVGAGFFGAMAKAMGEQMVYEKKLK